jgi:hypothetical protein
VENDYLQKQRCQISYNTFTRQEKEVKFGLSYILLPPSGCCIDGLLKLTYDLKVVIVDYLFSVRVGRTQAGQTCPKT